jgi:hypothetical protein
MLDMKIIRTFCHLMQDNMVHLEFIFVLLCTRFKQCCGFGSGRIRTFLAGSGHLGPDLDLDQDQDLNKWTNINFLGVCKTINT